MTNIIKNINTLLAASINSKNKLKFNSLEYNEFKHLYETEYKDMADKFDNDGVLIFKGFSEAPPIYSQVSPKLRKSENTLNFYTRLLSDVLPSWKDYPKRNRGFICTNNREKAAMYARLSNDRIMAVFPKNGSKIAVCSASDIWDSFKNTLAKYHIPELDVFNDIFQSFMSTTRINHKQLSKLFTLGSVNDIIDLFNSKEISIREEYKEGGYTIPKYNEFLFDIITYVMNGGSLLEFLDDLFNPQTNGFKLFDTKTYNIPYIFDKDYDNKGYEVWTDGECLFTPYKQLGI